MLCLQLYVAEFKGVGSETIPWACRAMRLVAAMAGAGCGLLLVAFWKPVSGERVAPRGYGAPEQFRHPEYFDVDVGWKGSVHRAICLMYLYCFSVFCC